MMIGWAEVYASLVLIIFILWWINNVTKKGKYYQTLPSPPGYPIVGNVLEVGDLNTMLDVLLKYSKKFGGIVRVNIGPVRKLILITDYKLLEFILSSTKLLNKSVEYKYFHRWLGTGLLTSDGPKWKKHRRILTPAFHFKILEQFIEVFEASGKVLIEKLSKNEGPNVDIYPFITLCTLDIICETAMGTTVDAQSHADSDYVWSVKSMCRILVERSVSPIEMVDTLYPLTANYRTENKALKILHEYSLGVIQKRQKEKLNMTNNEKDGDDGIKRKKAFLDLLLEATVDGRPLTQQEIREEVDTFMFEGHDTTASAISFALYCLANNQKVQEKAFAEQVELFGELKDCTVKYQDLMDMKYLEQVIKETLRLYPSVPFYARETDQDIEYNDITIPKGVTFSLFAYGIHRNPEYFPNPEEFNPSRFDEIDGKSPYAYIPFSAGPRNCIGQKFAMLEMKSTISKVLRNYELYSANPQHVLKLVPETVLKSSNGIRIGLRKRVI